MRISQEGLHVVVALGHHHHVSREGGREAGRQGWVSAQIADRREGGREGGREGRRDVPQGHLGKSAHGAEAEGGARGSEEELQDGDGRAQVTGWGGREGGREGEVDEDG
jgi:hypothetical protein